MENKKELLRKIPSVDELLKVEQIHSLMQLYPREVIVDTIREITQRNRLRIKSMDISKINNYSIDIVKIITETIDIVTKKMQNNFKKVINATGIILHTNLGRAVLSKDIIDDIKNIACSYSNLELDLSTGERGSRYEHIEHLICKLTGAEAAMVINNNAASVLLILDTLAKEKEVIVSRGQLVEIGGSFRIPDVMAKSGAVLKEIGTTNRTYLRDYENALNHNTAAFMKIHTSNYRICGFTSEVTLHELVSLGEKHDIPVIEDLGSGILLDFSRYGLPYEPTVQDSVRTGADVISFSGDKLLGGPQAGMIIGKAKYIEKMKKNQLTRALRIDKLSLMALEATLRQYLDEDNIKNTIPTIKMLTYTENQLIQKAETLFNKMNKDINLEFGEYYKINIENEYSEVGGGSMPLCKLPTRVITIKTTDEHINSLYYSLRCNDVPIIARIKNDKILLDIRTIFESDFNIIINGLIEALKRVRN